jgi:hypothetical protein
LERNVDLTRSLQERATFYRQFASKLGSSITADEFLQKAAQLEQEAKTVERPSIKSGRRFAVRKRALR